MSSSKVLFDPESTEKTKAEIGRAFWANSHRLLRACRVCFSYPAYEVCSAAAVRELSGVELTPHRGLRLSSALCRPCATLLRAAGVFRRTCVHSEAILREAASVYEEREVKREPPPRDPAIEPTVFVEVKQEPPDEDVSSEPSEDLALAQMKECIGQSENISTTDEAEQSHDPTEPICILTDVRTEIQTKQSKDPIEAKTVKRTLTHGQTKKPIGQAEKIFSKVRPIDPIAAKRILSHMQSRNHTQKTENIVPKVETEGSTDLIKPKTFILTHGQTTSIITGVETERPKGPIQPKFIRVFPGTEQTENMNKADLPRDPTKMKFIRILSSTPAKNPIGQMVEAGQSRDPTKPKFTRVLSGTHAKNPIVKTENITEGQAERVRDPTKLKKAPGSTEPKPAKNMRTQTQKEKRNRKVITVRVYVCDACGKSYYRRVAFIAHVRGHTLTTGNSGEPSLYTCDVCAKTFSQRPNLVAHMKWHGAKPYLCTVCGATFVVRQHLEWHANTHTGERPYACPACPMRFALPSTLQRHVASRHTGERPFACDACDKAFYTRDHLKQHRRQHTGEEPYACGACGKTFKQKPNMNSHMKTHHGGMVEWEKRGEEEPRARPARRAIKREGPKNLIRPKVVECTQTEEPAGRLENSLTEVEIELAEDPIEAKTFEHVLPHTQTEKTSVPPEKIFVEVEIEPPEESIESKMDERRLTEKPVGQLEKILAEVEVEPPEVTIETVKQILTNVQTEKPIAQTAKMFSRDQKRILTHVQPQYTQKTDDIFVKNETEPPVQPKIVTRILTRVQPNKAIEHVGPKSVEQCTQTSASVCDVCDLRFASPRAFGWHMRTHSSGPYACDVCGRTFPLRLHMVKHWRAAHSGRPQPGGARFECDVCGLRFVSHLSFGRHMRGAHPGGPYTCDACATTFSLRLRMIAHWRLHAPDRVKPHICLECGRRFAQRADLATHARIHTGERPYACLICSWRFTSRSALCRHTRRRHGREKETVIACDACGKRFRRTHTLEQHRRIVHGVVEERPRAVED